MTEPIKIQGHEFNKETELSELLESLKGMGGQASQVYKATQLLKKIMKLRESENEQERPLLIMGYTSNMMSCGIRETINFMCKHKLVDAIVTTGGGVEEDFMKCFFDPFIIEFEVDDNDMRDKNQNRTGNMLFPAELYAHLDDWLTP